MTRTGTMLNAVSFLLVGLLPMATLNATEFITNGDFQSGFEEFLAWPGYVSGTNDNGDVNPDQVPDWPGDGGRGVNYSNPQFPNSWTVEEGGIGINPIASGDAPFRDNGDNDTHVAFLQGVAALTQGATGLVVGQEYRLSWDYNSRNCCGDEPICGVRLNGIEVDSGDFQDTVIAVGGIEPWYNEEITFTADSADLDITFTSEPTSGGDATLLLDNIQLYTDADATNLLGNGDFETDAEGYNVWPGYSGAGVSPFRDNGNNFSAVAFLQGAAFIGQTVEGLTAGDEYLLSLEFNARVCCGDAPIGSLFIDDELIEEFPGDAFDDGLVEPVGELNDWYRFETVIVAEASELELRITAEPANGGDASFLVDNVSLTENVAAVPGDFNQDGLLTAIDIDLLNEEIRAGTDLAEFDVTGDGRVNGDDRTMWVESLKNTYFGDANLDGEFNSADFVDVFGSGEYEDSTPFNSTWGDGDWNGDGDFNSTDFVTAFTGGGYENGPRAAANAVPEPTSLLMLLTAMGLLTRFRQR